MSGSLARLLRVSVEVRVPPWPRGAPPYFLLPPLTHARVEVHLLCSLGSPLEELLYCAVSHPKTDFRKNQCATGRTIP